MGRVITMVDSQVRSVADPWVALGAAGTEPEPVRAGLVDGISEC